MAEMFPTASNKSGVGNDASIPNSDNGGKEKVNMAVGFMLDLKDKAQELMDIQIPGGTGETYGPCWRYVNNDSH